MSSERLEENVGEMIRRGALRPDEGQARRRFLQAVEAPEERRSWKFAAAAAAIVVTVTIVWSARTERPEGGQTGQSTTKPSPEVPTSGRPLGSDFEDDLLGADFTLHGKTKPRQVTFLGISSKFPERFFFRVRVHRASEKVVGGKIVSYDRESEAGTVPLQKGRIEYRWEYTGPVMVRVDVSASDDLQERDLVRAVKIPEPRRNWSFPCAVWNQDVLWRLEPQYPEALDLARDLRNLVGRIEEAVANEPLFKSREKALIAEAERLQARASSFGKNSLFPASMGEVEVAARDLAVSIPIFKWEDGKFSGPKSYYTNDKTATTSQGDPFGFDAFRRYADQAVLAAGREFVLWIVRDAQKDGLEEAHRKMLRDHSLKPGVEDFAQKILQNNYDAKQLAGMEAEIRILKK